MMAQQVKQVLRVVFIVGEVSCSSGPSVVMRELRHLPTHWCTSTHEEGIVTSSVSMRLSVGST